MNLYRKKTGNLGEKLACEYLVKKDYQILERNYLIRGGEIDIIAQDGDSLVFVEVKTRFSHDYGLPIESITRGKIRSLLKTSLFYIQKINWGNKPYRLDLVTVDFADNRSNPLVEHIENITF
jgi:putative endonuclease